MSNYENCTVAIWEVTYFLKDEEGDDVLNEDGSVKLFRDCGDVDVSTWAEWVEPDMLEEIDDDCLAAEMDSSDIEMLQEQLRKFSPPQEYDDE